MHDITKPGAIKDQILIRLKTVEFIFVRIIFSIIMKKTNYFCFTASVL
jgi:hypothetical protein